jgi:hypothetical protein
MHHPTVVHRRPVRQPHGAPARAFSWVPPASSVHWTQKATLAIGLAAKPQWASPPREGKFTPADAAKFVICDDTIELTIKELKGGLHLGRMQVSQDAARVERSIVLPVCAYLLLVRLYGTEQGEHKDWSLFQLKQRFVEVFMQDQVQRVEQKWLRKWRKIKLAA